MGLIQDYSLVLIFFILPIIFVLQPLFLAKITKGKDETDLVSLKRKKRLLYRQIKELEMEYDMGTVSPSDFQRNRNELKLEASSILDKLESLGKTTAVD